jgi:hypothetical protein
VELQEVGSDTRLTYTVKAAVGGRLGQVGGRMIDASAKQLADQFFEALRVRLAPPAQAEALPASEAVAPPASEAASAEQVRAAVVPAPMLPVAPAAATGEGTRILWFLLGAASTGFGVWLAKVLG